MLNANIVSIGQGIKMSSYPLVLFLLEPFNAVSQQNLMATWFDISIKSNANST